MGLYRVVFKSMTRLYPFYSGYYKVLSSPQFERLMPPSRADEVVTARLRDGARFLIRLDDLMSRAFYYLGEWDPWVSWFSRRLLRPGDVMLDIGANFGAASLVAARYIGPQGSVHAFEPQPDLADLILKSAELNCLKNIYVHRVALSDRNGSMDLSIPGDNTGGASLSREFGASSRTIRVDVRETSDYLAQLDLPSVRFRSGS